MRVTADVKSINSTRTKMENNYNELLQMIQNFKEKIENTKVIYDTESALLYRKLSIGYIELMEKYLNNEFKPYIDKLSEIENTYTDEYNITKKSVQGGTL